MKPPLTDSSVTRHTPYVTRLGCLVQRETSVMPNGKLHERITLESAPKGLRVPRRPR